MKDRDTFVRKLKKMFGKKLINVYNNFSIKAKAIFKEWMYFSKGSSF